MLDKGVMQKKKNTLTSISLETDFKMNLWVWIIADKKFLLVAYEIPKILGILQPDKYG